MQKSSADIKKHYQVVRRKIFLLAARGDFSMFVGKLMHWWRWNKFIVASRRVPIVTQFLLFSLGRLMTVEMLLSTRNCIGMPVVWMEEGLKLVNWTVGWMVPGGKCNVWGVIRIFRNSGLTGKFGIYLQMSNKKNYIGWVVA